MTSRHEKFPTICLGFVIRTFLFCWFIFSYIDLYSANTLPLPIPFCSDTLIPSVEIASSEQGPVCPGTSITYTAYPVYGGTNPSYQWTLDGVAIPEATQNQYSLIVPYEGELKVEMLSNHPCVSTSRISSIVPAIEVYPAIKPTVSIEGMPQAAICVNTTIQLKANYSNAGIDPIFRWIVNETTRQNSPSDVFEWLDPHDDDSVTLIINTISECANPQSDTVRTRSITVIEGLQPKVSILNTLTKSICQGDTVSFEAIPIYGGTQPKYQWQINGEDVPGATNRIFTTNELEHNAVLSVRMRSNATCLAVDSALDVTQPIRVEPNRKPEVKITPSEFSVRCVGPIELSAFPINGGSKPQFKWYINGEEQLNDTLYSFVRDSIWVNDTIKVVLVSSLACTQPPEISDSLVVTDAQIEPPPGVVIEGFPTEPICEDSSIVLTAIPTNGGEMPVFQWQLNGTNIQGDTSNIFQAHNLQSGDVISVRMTAHFPCLQPIKVEASTPPWDLIPSDTPTVIIEGFPTEPICEDSSISLTAISTNGGEMPFFQWQLNGIDIAGATTPIFEPAHLQSGDIISVHMISNQKCVRPQQVYDTMPAVIFAPTIAPSLSIEGFPTEPICEDSSIILTAIPTNGGEMPEFQWQLNGTDIAGATTPIFGAAYLQSGDVISVRMTSNQKCAIPREVSIATDSLILLPLPDAGILSGPSTCTVGDSCIVSASKSGGKWIYIDTIYATFEDGKLLAKQKGEVQINYVVTNSCGTDTANIRIIITDDDPTKDTTQIIPNIFVPNEENGQGTWVIPNLEFFPDSKLAIYNRWGGLVYETMNYQNDWNGTSKGEKLPSATYYYIFQRKEKQKYTVFKGFIHLFQ